MDAFSVHLPRKSSVIFKTGTKLSAIIYQGTEPIIVEAVQNYLKVFKDKNKPLPLKNTDFNMKIDDVVTETSEDFLKTTTHYRVILKGELL